MVLWLAKLPFVLAKHTRSSFVRGGPAQRRSETRQGSGEFGRVG